MKLVGATVTYANRSEFCIRSVQALIDGGVDAVVVVLNGVSAQSEHRIVAMSELDDRIHLLAWDRNAGSARAFAAAIKNAFNLAADAVILVDDDNVVRPHSVATVRKALGAGSRDLQVFQCVREDDHRHAAIAAGQSSRDIYPPTGAFLSFDIWRRVRRDLGMVGRTSADSHLLPYAPYGGLVLTGGVVDRIGLPDARLFLYEDDTEYSARIVALGGRIELLSSARVVDIDHKWSAGSGNGLVNLLDSTSPVRLYFAVRNRVRFERSCCRTALSKLRFAGNAVVVCWIALIFTAAKPSRRQNLKLMLRALRASRGALPSPPMAVDDAQRLVLEWVA